MATVIRIVSVKRLRNKRMPGVSPDEASRNRAINDWREASLSSTVASPCSSGPRLTMARSRTPAVILQTRW